MIFAPDSSRNALSDLRFFSVMYVFVHSLRKNPRPPRLARDFGANGAHARRIDAFPRYHVRLAGGGTSHVRADMGYRYRNL